MKMVWINGKISEEANKKLMITKAVHSFKRKIEALEYIIKNYSEV